ncbi:LOW QUALITY PROTEIN: hypothetical protein CVT25_002445 [Psilocybe cyanescens]|uniref:Uncharacterized protein n=1 Tax=Psilocybe cyanescens TaxID=93625 RepID=A0A409XUI0_PSICY|nr:LOW QUALITY PROTEIN: hypothetical protein CVT25_002445 [Psilocybe cyanescens]
MSLETALTKLANISLRMWSYGIATLWTILKSSFRIQLLNKVNATNLDEYTEKVIIRIGNMKKCGQPIGGGTSRISFQQELQSHLYVFQRTRPVSPTNISKDVCKKPSARAMVLLGYIPVCKLECFSKKYHSMQGYQLFHNCMWKLLVPLVEAETLGVDMTCTDRFVREVYPLLAAYITKYPEQCLVRCCKENSCPKSQVFPQDRGDHCLKSILWDLDKTMEVLTQQVEGLKPNKFKKQQLCLIKPFWKDLPHCNIFDAMILDLLHQLHKGVFKDHIATLATEGGMKEVNTRFIHLLLQERDIVDDPMDRKGIQKHGKVFLGVIAGATNPQVICAVCGVLNFIYYAHFEMHCDESLAELDSAWLTFHKNKDIFKDLDIREHFNISKIHSVMHYVNSIRSHGTTDGFNTDCTLISPRWATYIAGNKKEYIKQMWAVPGYQADIAETSKPLPNKGNGDDLVEEDKEVEEQVTVIHSVAKTPLFMQVTVQLLVENFGTVNIITGLNTFLTDAKLAKRVTDTTTFSMYKRVGLTLPRILEASSVLVKDNTFATKAFPGQITKAGIIKPAPARFSTALI